MSIKKVLVTGANGMLGQKLVDLFMFNDNFDVLFTSSGKSRLNPKYNLKYTTLDITNKEHVISIVDNFNPDVVINCAAMTNVDGCEISKTECWDLNVHPITYFIDAIGNLPTKFIHISTDFVFDGQSNKPYLETDETNPLSAYALSKNESEDILSKSNIDFVILRTSFVYGVLYDNSRSNFVLWSKSSLEQGKQINVISDQYRAPTFAEDLANACINAINKNAKGVYHVVGPETFSILGLIKKVATFWNLDQSLISPILTQDLNQKAKRPLFTNLSIEKAQSDLGYRPVSFEESLKIIDNQLNTKS